MDFPRYEKWVASSTTCVEDVSSNAVDLDVIGRRFTTYRHTRTIQYVGGLNSRRVLRCALNVRRFSGDKDKESIKFLGDLDNALNGTKTQPPQRVCPRQNEAIKGGRIRDEHPTILSLPPSSSAATPPQGRCRCLLWRWHRWWRQRAEGGTLRYAQTLISAFSVLLLVFVASDSAI